MITSIQNSRIKQFALLQTKRGRDASKLFIVEGEHLIQAAISVGVLDVLIYSGSNEYHDGPWETIEVSRTVLERLSNVKTPSNYIGICHMNENIKSSLPSRIIALNDVQDPGNGGTIARSAIAFNFPLMWLSNDSFDWYNDKMIRSTMGAWFTLQHERVSLSSSLLQAKQDGYQIVIADSNPPFITLSDYIPTHRMVLVMGSEGQGISPEIRSLADVIIRIPMSPQMESLNVGVAASIIMERIYEHDQQNKRDQL